PLKGFGQDSYPILRTAKRVGNGRLDYNNDRGASTRFSKQIPLTSGREGHVLLRRDTNPVWMRLQSTLRWSSWVLPVHVLDVLIRVRHITYLTYGIHLPADL